MEILNVEGLLTDFEVYEVLTSDSYKKYREFPAHSQKIRESMKRIDDLKKQMKIYSDKAMSVKAREAHARHEMQMERELKSLAKLKRQEETVWMKHYALQYLSTLPASTQTNEAIQTFFRDIKAFCKKHSIELMAHEVMQLVNIRPTSDVILNIVVENVYERIRNEDIRNELLNIIGALPEPPVVEEEFVEAEQEEESAIAVLEATAEEGTSLMAEDEEIRELANADEQLKAADEEMEFNTDSRRQVDGDDEGGEQEEGTASVRSRGFRRR